MGSGTLPEILPEHDAQTPQFSLGQSLFKMDRSKVGKSCGQTSCNLKFLLEIMDTASSGQKRSGTRQLVMSFVQKSCISDGIGASRTCNLHLKRHHQTMIKDRNRF